MGKNGTTAFRSDASAGAVLAMKTLEMKIPPAATGSYPIYISHCLLNHYKTWFKPNWFQKRLIIITDDTVRSYYGVTLLKKLRQENLAVDLFSFPAGEASKNYHTKQMLEEKMLSTYCDRETLLLALGGGVVGDITGFIAATYMRGISYVHLPTSFLAMVDSSIGGKTSIDMPQGKNLIGAFWQPEAVIIDIACLETLPQIHLINGVVEALKTFLIYDKSSFHYLQDNLEKFLSKNNDVLMYVLQKALTIKINIVNQDEKEKNIRKVLNFGHTMGHAIEKVNNFNILHGFAVGVGILVESKISELCGVLKAEEYRMIENFLSQLHITPSFLKAFSLDDILQATRIDKKNAHGKVKYILLKEIGKIHTDAQQVVHEVSDKIVVKALKMLSEVNDARQ
jgi:3-dehydroquinate synthase